MDEPAHIVQLPLEQRRCRAAEGLRRNPGEPPRTFTGDDVNHTVVVKEIARNASGVRQAASSAPTAMVTLAPEPPPAGTRQTVTTLFSNTADCPRCERSRDADRRGNGERQGGLRHNANVLYGRSAISPGVHQPVRPPLVPASATCQTVVRRVHGERPPPPAFSPGATMTASASPRVSLTIGRDETSTALDVRRRWERHERDVHRDESPVRPAGLAPCNQPAQSGASTAEQPSSSCSSEPLTQASAACESPPYARQPAHHRRIRRRRQFPRFLRAGTADDCGQHASSGIVGLITSTMQCKLLLHVRLHEGAHARGQRSLRRDCHHNLPKTGMSLRQEGDPRRRGHGGVEAGAHPHLRKSTAGSTWRPDSTVAGLAVGAPPPSPSLGLARLVSPTSSRPRPLAAHPDRPAAPPGRPARRRV